MTSPTKPKRVRKAKDAASANNSVTERTREHLWKPGQSGNPNGRPAVVREIRDLARAKTTIAFDTLCAACQSEDAPWAARVAAAAHILDRGYGKPTQNINAAVRDAQKMTDAELIAYLTGSDEADSGEGIAEASSDPGQLN